MSTNLDPVAHSVLEDYPVPLRGRLEALGNRGGFSGARLWKVGDACLRAWPTNGPTPARLNWIHGLMSAARDAGLRFVPAVLKTCSGKGWVECGSRLWDLTTWQSGRADYGESPSPLRLHAACTALAQVHVAWASIETDNGPCPAVQRRLQTLANWQELLRSGWRPDLHPTDDPVCPWAIRGWEALAPRLHGLPALLAGWADQRLPLQPCLCDIWHDHVLFEGDAVTGLIDYGSVRMDHAAADLARLLGSLAGNDAGQWQAGFAAYALQRRLSAEEMALAQLLDQTGTVLGVANWLRWLYHEKRDYEDRAAVAGRLAVLVDRIEGWA